MNKTSPDESALSPHRAFVVQLTENTDAERDQWAGRIEHVTSGQATRFKSIEQVVSFMANVLAALAKATPAR